VYGGFCATIGIKSLHSIRFHHRIHRQAHLRKTRSAIARRAIHTIAVISIGITKNGDVHNPVLREYYQEKCKSKPKSVALGAVSHKVCNIIFAVLRDNKPFAVRSNEEHIKEYESKVSKLA
jgi:hypothetical protein